MADTQKEINDIFAEYSAAEDPEVEDELDKLADEMKDQEDKLPSGINYIIYYFLDQQGFFFQINYI